MWLPSSVSELNRFVRKAACGSTLAIARVVSLQGGVTSTKTATGKIATKGTKDAQISAQPTTQLNTSEATTISTVLQRARAIPLKRLLATEVEQAPEALHPFHV